MSLGNHAGIAVAALWDILLPGAAGWPCASAVIRIDAVSDMADRDWMIAHAVRVAELAEAERVAAVAGLERDEPEPFARMLSSVYAAYYTTVEVQACVRLLAEAGPREASPQFEIGLLDQVIRHQRGLRRSV